MIRRLLGLAWTIAVGTALLVGADDKGTAPAGMLAEKDNGGRAGQGTNVLANATAVERPTRSFGVKDGAIVLRQEEEHVE